MNIIISTGFIAGATYGMSKLATYLTTAPSTEDKTQIVWLNIARKYFAHTYQNVATTLWGGVFKGLRYIVFDNAWIAFALLSVTSSSCFFSSMNMHGIEDIFERFLYFCYAVTAIKLVISTAFCRIRASFE